MIDKLKDFCKQNIVDFADVLAMLENECHVLHFDENGFLVSNKNRTYCNLHAKNIESASEIISLIPLSTSLICAHEDFYENLLTNRFNVKDITRCYQYTYVKKEPVATKNGEGFEIKLIAENDLDLFLAIIKEQTISST